MIFAYVLMPIFAAAASVLLACLAFYGAMQKRIQPELVMFFVITTAGALGFFFMGRDLTLIGAQAALEQGAETTLSRFANVLAILLCFVAFIQLCLKGVVSRTGVLIFGAALQYYFVCFIYPSSFDRWYKFDHSYIYPIVGLTIVMAPSALGAYRLARYFIWATSIPALLSIILLVVRHDAAMLDSYQSVLPFLPGRLYGATSHPNIMGSLSVFGLLLLLAFPPGRKLEFWGLLALDASTLLLSQSKTSWITFLIGAAIIRFPTIKKFRGRVPSGVLVIVFLTLAALPAVASVADHSLYGALSGNENIKTLGTLTGRTDIWKASFALLEQHLVTGPGYATFEVYMASLFPDLVPNPHNLYLATLLQAGLIGLASLTIYLITLTAAAFSLNGRTRSFAIAYVVLIFVRGVSESFTLQAAFIGPNFWALIMFMRLMSVSAGENRQAQRVAPSTERDQFLH